MKKIIYGGMVLAGLLLLASCGPKENVGPIDFTNDNITRTPIVVPTCTPTVTPTPDSKEQPTVTPTKKPEPTEELQPTETPEPTAELTPEPTAEPTVTPTKEPTATPTPTEIPAEPTIEPTPEVTPTIVPVLIPSPAPTEIPVLSTEDMVKNGWQKTVSIEETHQIIFPELFRESTVEKVGRELKTSYSCPEDKSVSFEIVYQMQKTVEEAVNELPAGTILDGSLEEKQITYFWQENNTLYRGIFLEVLYPQYLLGDAFADNEQVVSTIRIVFAYPTEMRTTYETSEYNYYIINNGEE